MARPAPQSDPAGPPSTMRDVARRAGVSVATVSRALRGAPEVPAATRKRVVAAAGALGYQLHPFVSTLMRARRLRSSLSGPPPLAFVTAYPTSTGWQHLPTPLLPLMFAGARERAAQRGYSLTHYWLHQDGMSPRRFSDMLRARGVRGLLVPPPPDYSFSIDLAWEHFSTVILGVIPLARQLHCVSNDHYQSMQLAMEMCWNRGYRRPALAVDATTNHRLERRWEAAFEVTQREHPFAARIAPLLFRDWDEKQLRLWVQREQPDVLISVFTVAQLELLRAAGLDIPRRLGLVSLSVHQDPGPISGIGQSAALMGATAADQLIAAIERDDFGVPGRPVTLALRGSWIEGGTLPPRKPKA